MTDIAWPYGIDGGAYAVHLVLHRRLLRRIDAERGLREVRRLADLPRQREIALALANSQ